MNQLTLGLTMIGIVIIMLLGGWHIYEQNVTELAETCDESDVLMDPVRIRQPGTNRWVSLDNDLMYCVPIDYLYNKGDAQ
jgi:hypothetical protein